MCVGYCELNAAPPAYCFLYQKRKIPLPNIMYSSVTCFSFQLELKRTKGKLRAFVYSKEKSKLLLIQ